MAKLFSETNSKVLSIRSQPQLRPQFESLEDRCLLSAVVGRALFYNQSGTTGVNGRYDHNDVAINTFDDNAIATDKSALLPNSTTATFANVSSYSKGINGIMVDIAGAHGAITAADFEFHVGNNNSPTTWDLAPAPTGLVVRALAGVGGSDRIELIWANNAIQKQWLEVIVLANANTALPQGLGLLPGHGDVFFFGNALGDSSFGDTAVNATVNATDSLAARNNPATLLNNIPITNLYDYNRDSQVNATDQVIDNNNGTTPLNVTKFLNITPPVAPDASPAAATGLPNLSSLGSAASTLFAQAQLRQLLSQLNVPSWAVDRIKSIDLNHGVVADVLTLASRFDTPAVRRILVQADEIADRLGLDDSLLDAILAGWGLE